MFNYCIYEYKVYQFRTVLLHPSLSLILLRVGQMLAFRLSLNEHATNKTRRDENSVVSMVGITHANSKYHTQNYMTWTFDSRANWKGPTFPNGFCKAIRADGKRTAILARSLSSVLEIHLTSNNDVDYSKRVRSNGFIHLSLILCVLKSAFQ